jgi:hypothetical protein
MGKARRVRPLTLDAGALVALERNDWDVHETVRVALDAGLDVMVPAAALAQVWRGGPRQAPLARLLKLHGVEVADLDEEAAKTSGELCGHTGTHDVIDASVVVCARTQSGGGTVLTSDPHDIRRLDATLHVERV